MKNFKSLLVAALFACVGSVFAIEAPGSVATLPEQGCKTAYQLVTPRGSLYYDAAVEENCLTSNCQTGRNWSAGVTSLAKNDSRSQFLLFPAEGEHTYFIYSVGAGKFIYQSGVRANLTDTPTEVYVWAHGLSATKNQAYGAGSYNEADYPFTIASAYNASPSGANQINSINICCWEAANPDYRWCETSGYDDGNVFAFVACEEAPAAVYEAAWTKVKEALGIVDPNPAQVAYESWYNLVMVDMKALAAEYGNVAPTEDEVGKKPAEVVAAVVNYYKANNWLFSEFAGFGKNGWEAAENYYVGWNSSVAEEYAKALAVWQAYVDAELVAEPEPVVDEYPVNFDKDLKMTHESRYTSSVSLQVEDEDVQTINIPNAAKKMLVYNDLHEQTFTVPAGATVTPTIGYIGEWMHGYVYLDANDNKQFEVLDYQSADDELVSFSFYSPTDAGSGLNSAGATVKNDCNAKVLPAFVAPEKPGSYRMRYIVDWNCIDPAGQYGPNYSSNFINNNGGVIVDVTLVVEGQEPAAPEYNTTTQYFTAPELRAEADATGKALIGIAGVTTTANKYINGKAYNGTLLSEEGTLAGVRAPQADEIMEVLPTEGGYLLRQADAPEGEGYLVCAAGGNFTTGVATAANVWQILSPSEEGYGSISGYADLFADIDASMSNENLVRFISNGQYLNGQNRDGVGGLRGGTGAWSFNYIYNANYSEEDTPEPVDPNVAAYEEWKVLLAFDGPVDIIAYEYGYNKMEADVVGKKPAEVVNPIIDIYQTRYGLANNADPVTAMVMLGSLYNTTFVEDVAYIKAALAAYDAAEIVTEVVPSYVEPVLSAADVSDKVAYYIYTTARGGLTVTGASATGIVGTSESGVGQTVDPTDVRQQFAFVNWEGNLYLYSLATQKFLGMGITNKGLFTDKPVDPILFKNAGNGTVMLYFDNSHNVNLGGSKQVTIDGWSTKDAGNSFIIKVAEPFDQTPVLEFLAYHEWNGNVLYPETPNTIDDLLDFELEFEDARTVEEAPMGILGAIFDETGDAYAVVLGDRFVDEPLTTNEGKVTVHFTKISDITADLQDAARKAVARANTAETAGKAKVVICSKSLLIDGENLYTDVVVKEYNLDGHGALTGIQSVQTAPAAAIFDLQGRRVSNTQNGLYIQNGKKVIR